MNSCINGFLVAISFCSFANVAYAQSDEKPMRTDRPDFTQGANTIPQGITQIEGGGTFTRSGPERMVMGGELNVRIGTGKRSELRLGLPSYVRMRIAGQGHDSGVDDGFIGFRYRLNSPEAKRGLAVIAETTLPVGTRRVVQNRYQPRLVLAAQVADLGPYSVTANLGYGRLVNFGDRFSQGWVSVSAKDYASPQSRLGSFFEFYAFNREESGGPAHKFVSGGLMYALGANTQADARVGFGLNNGADGPDYFYGIGVSQRF